MLVLSSYFPTFIIKAYPFFICLFNGYNKRFDVFLLMLQIVATDMSMILMFYLRESLHTRTKTKSREFIRIEHFKGVKRYKLR